uniref:ANK_REP_REGION domain-containing protein n=1 Tax=Macrostomum lignano TaxID=282301 RepID=A0A1I8JQ90_9PLAT
LTPFASSCKRRPARESELGRRDYLDLGETSGQTALHLACSESDADICGQLLAAAEAAGEGFLKRFVNKKDVEHVTCLHCAVEHGAVDVVEDAVAERLHFIWPPPELVTFAYGAAGGKHGAKLDAVDLPEPVRPSDESRKQPIPQANGSHKAAFFAQPSLLANLLERSEMARRSSLDCRDREGNTPLMLASTEKDDPECARLLLAKGASPLCTDGQGRTAVYLATHWYNRQVLQALLDHPAVRDARIIDESDAANNSPAARHVDIVELLLENGADAEAKNEDEETPMHLAAPRLATCRLFADFSKSTFR